MEYKTPKQYAADHPEISWKKRRDGFQLYNTSNSRFNVSIEEGVDERGNAWWLGLSNEYGEAGIHESELDAHAFADDFIRHFCYQLSLREVRILIPKMQEFYDKWEASRQEAMKRL